MRRLIALLVLVALAVPSCGNIHDSDITPTATGSATYVPNHDRLVKALVQAGWAKKEIRPTGKYEDINHVLVTEMVGAHKCEVTMGYYPPSSYQVAEIAGQLPTSWTGFDPATVVQPGVSRKTLDEQLRFGLTGGTLTC